MWRFQKNYIIKYKFATNIKQALNYIPADNHIFANVQVFKHFRKAHFHQRATFALW